MAVCVHGWQRIFQDSERLHTIWVLSVQPGRPFVRQLLGRLHCSTPYPHACRQVARVAGEVRSIRQFVHGQRIDPLRVRSQYQSVLECGRGPMTVLERFV